MFRNNPLTHKLRCCAAKSTNRANYIYQLRCQRSHTGNFHNSYQPLQFYTNISLYATKNVIRFNHHQRNLIKLINRMICLCHHTCPVAIKMAVTVLAACALKPPMLPAMAEPIKFLLMLRSTRAATVVLSVVVTMLAGTMASHTTDLPRPSSLGNE